MKKYRIKVSEEMSKILEASAREKNISIEKNIEEILSRFIISPHILDSEDVQKGYAECAQINLDWANL